MIPRATTNLKDDMSKEPFTTEQRFWITTWMVVILCTSLGVIGIILAAK